ncbi:prolyl oligopeptidase family serine peptidase [Micromonospora sp. WMMD882]|uniref:prolyl oligopeptidase family serine peptidase n=1 Tax=Micromonospora sp. WMMD882 TaxID=3015151 RepID=UPI00248B3930|nr:prolyl oligopeptidase family serine peptidase [Micromonospora sp. WMMD882]WBB82441.1 prolyl oligopeptidase family serine peptidase [Micromonospora sp. WMMD882]
MRACRPVRARRARRAPPDGPVRRTTGGRCRAAAPRASGRWRPRTVDPSRLADSRAGTPTAEASGIVRKMRSDDGDDPYLWLEDLDGDDAAAWVRERNAETVAAVAGGETFDRLRAGIREVFDSDERVPYPGWRGDGFWYGFWRDAAHPRGLWRRTTSTQYRRAEPEWDVLLDVDALADREGENWVWGGAQCLRPGNERVLVSLSRGGADAVVVREFDLRRRSFVEDGFQVPEAKTRVRWIDADHVFVATDFGPGSMTTSGYPRVVRRWRRGTPLAAAEVVYAGRPDDLTVYASHDPTPGFARDFVVRSLDFYRSEKYLLTAAGELVRIPVPDDAGWDVHREWLLVQLRSPWTVDGVTHPAGALLVTRFDAFLAGGRELTTLFRPDSRTALSSYAWTRHHLILASTVDVRSRLEVATPGDAGWRSAPLAGVPEHAHSVVVDTDPDRDDAYLLASTGFLEPTTLRLGQVDGPVETLKREPAFFDADGMAVRQFFATSADGTRVPYFVVGDPDAAGGPALLTGYGGFEVSQMPHYSGAVGRAWLARGGTYVVANIRGGAEYGPDWHRAALRENRPRAFEDFAAVATDLVTRGVTTPDRLGIEGGSNGGLLMGVMLTRRPELFGAVVAHVPLLDMRRYHRLLAGASWMAEYGDPDQPADWAFLRGYSPYHNVRAGRAYPPLLLVTSTRDDRVHPGHARKMAARLREHGHDVAYYENVEGGHGAAANNEQRAFVWALTLEFLWQRLTGDGLTGERAVPRQPADRSATPAGTTQAVR